MPKYAVGLVMGFQSSADPALAGNWRWARLSLMQGTHLHISISRALQRMAGIMVGAALIWPILAQEPPMWSVIAVLFFLQVATEMIHGTGTGVRPTGGRRLRHHPAVACSTTTGSISLAITHHTRTAREFDHRTV